MDDPLPIVILLVGVGIWLAIGFGTASIAETKGRERGAWLAAGLLGGLIALVIVLLLPPLPEDGAQRWAVSPPTREGQHGATTAAGQRKCPFCAEWIKWRRFSVAIATLQSSRCPRPKHQGLRMAW